MKIRLLRNRYEYDEQYLEKGKTHYPKHRSVDIEYFSNLDDELFSREDIVKLYHNDRRDIEQVNSCNPIIILNELSSKIIFYNLESLIFMVCEDKDDKDHLPDSKHVIEMCRSSVFISSFFLGKFKNSYLKGVIKECSRVKVMIIKDRHYKRRNKFRRSIKQDRHRIDGRNNPPLMITKAGIFTTNV